MRRICSGTGLRELQRVSVAERRLNPVVTYSTGGYEECPELPANERDYPG